MIKNKGMFFSGLGLLIFQLFGGLLFMFKDYSVSDGTANIIIGSVFMICLTLTSVFLMVFGALHE